MHARSCNRSRQAAACTPSGAHLHAALRGVRLRLQLLQLLLDRHGRQLGGLGALAPRLDLLAQLRHLVLEARQLLLGLRIGRMAQRGRVDGRW